MRKRSSTYTLFTRDSSNGNANSVTTYWPGNKDK